MNPIPRITVAPNGARLRKADHAALPMTAQELAQTAYACQIAGADAIHLHVRDAQGRHSLDPDIYRDAMAAVSQSAPGMGIQITTEAGARYDVADQLRLLQTLKPAAASIAIREIARAPEMVAEVYATASTHKTDVQHILYGPGCLDQLQDWWARGWAPETMRDAILVLGRYDPPRAGRPDEVKPLVDLAHRAGLRVTVCAFGPDEQACLLAAADMGCNLRVGFENNHVAPAGTVWPDNATAVASLRTALHTHVVTGSRDANHAQPNGVF
ncbi:3-keto-5-aminohexanoate cleavage protein [Tateyamaria sp. SN3-11]|uniref:3-keto-5-aminohexanoate cleavage protein n=1 Tax=Tateyamaria sp. SN3-11 TaxID=3092147 RepID=UPI0039ECBF18